MKIRKIIVGVDFSPYSEVARLRAYELAATVDAEIVLVHALEDADYMAQKRLLLARETFDRLLQRGREETRERLEEIAAEGKPLGVKVQVELSESHPDVALLEAIDRHEADLVAIGTHGHTGFERLMLARIAERVVRRSPCSVLVARASKQAVPTMSRILVPTDYSESANEALAAACSLAAEGGTIDVLHCWRSPFFSSGYRGLSEEAIAFAPELTDSAQKQGAALIERYSNPHVNLHFEERRESAARGIQEVLEATAYDLVVLGSHGYRGVERFLLGSVAEATARHANCSVLVVREQR